MPATRDQSKNGHNNDFKPNLATDFSRKLLLLPTNNLPPENSVRLIKVKHPKSNIPVYFHLFKNESTKYFEINELLQFSEEYRSWFLDDFVVEDGSFLMSSPINPLYLVLPNLQQVASKNFIPFEDIFVDDECPAIKHLQFTKITNNISEVCDEKIISSGDTKVYRYNPEKTLNWLEKQVNYLAGILKTDGDLNETILSNNESLIRLSWHVLSEYLNVELSSALKDKLNITESVKRECEPLLESTGIPLNKRSKSAVEPLEDYCSDSSPLLSKANEWIREKFFKRECVCIVPTSKDSNKCGCGRYLAHHYFFENEYESDENNLLRWSIAKCTALYPTDAFGTLSFHGLHSLNKSQYIRLDFATDPQDIWNLLVDVWGYEPPKLIISIDGSNGNFEISDNLERSLKIGLLNAAKTTNAWIVTSGSRSGAVKLAAKALNDNFSASKLKFTVIGILPWAAIKRCDELLNMGNTIPYYPQANSSQNRYVSLCEVHSCFLLVDNGTIGRPGAENFLRQRFENFLKTKHMKKSNLSIPMVNLILGGNQHTLHKMLSSVCGKPPVPTVVCNGSGRSADVVSYAYKLCQNIDISRIDEKSKKKLLRKIKRTLPTAEDESDKIYKIVVLLMKKRDLINVFSKEFDEFSDEGLDSVILNGLLQEQRHSPMQQLNLVLTWNREDLAREIFEMGYDWPVGSLDIVMMQALTMDKVGFVQLLLENGIEMEKFLTIPRLEELYNTECGPLNTLNYLLEDVGKYKNYNLLNVGLIFNKLMGGGFQSIYASKEFKRRYSSQLIVHQPVVQKETADKMLTRKGSFGQSGIPFSRPFNDLFLWAVLTKRHEMAKCMWEHGEEPLAKALIGYRLNAMLAKEAEDDYFKDEICGHFRKNAEDFKNLAINLLEKCYQTDGDLTCQLLTYELKSWSKMSNISLAALAEYRTLISHASCQILMNDLWLGGLKIRKNINVKVLCSTLCPPLICLLPFKTQDQLLYQAQTEAEYQENRQLDNDSDSDSDSDDDPSETKRCVSLDLERNSAVHINVHAKYSEAIVKPKTVSRTLPLSVSSVGLSTHNEETHTGTDDFHARNLMPPSTSSFSPERKNKMRNRMSNSNLIDPEELEELNALASLAIRKISNGASIQHHLKHTTSDQTCTTCSQQKCECMPSGARNHPRSSTLGNDIDANENSPLIAGQHTPRFKKYNQLPTKKKFREFYQAPITCFWSFVVGYLFFLGTYTYVVLLATTDVLQWPEYYVILYISTFSIDQIRRILLQEPKIVSAKISVYFHRVWDCLSCLFCVMFFIGMSLRLSNEKSTRMLGRIFYACNIPCWYIYSLHLLTVSSLLGPYIFMFGKMVLKMCYLVVILFILLISFGVARQSILFPYEKVWNWELLKHTVYHPYFMLYGEVYADSIDDCGDNGTNCVMGYWLSIIFMTIYLLLSVVVFVNMMIAAFNHVFINLHSQTHLIWHMQRYNQIMEFEQQPFLPPPFIILSDLYLLIKYLYRRLCKGDKTYHFEHALRLHLNTSELDKLHEFEMACLKDVLALQQHSSPSSVEHQLQEIKEQMEKSVVQKIDSHFKEITKSQSMSFGNLSDARSSFSSDGEQIQPASDKNYKTGSHRSQSNTKLNENVEKSVVKQSPVYSEKRHLTEQEPEPNADKLPLRHVKWASYDETDEYEQEE